MIDSWNKKVCNLTDSIANVGRKKKTQHLSMQINIQNEEINFGYEVRFVSRDYT